jgi:hypothetical protein
MRYDHLSCISLWLYILSRKDNGASIGSGTYHNWDAPPDHA